MAYNSLAEVMGIWSYIVMFIIINVAFFIHEFAKVCIANLISEHAVTKGVPIRKFIEPIGLILMIYAGVGWSNSCEINPIYFKDRKKDTLKVYLGAVIVNLVIGFVLIVATINMQSNATYIFGSSNMVIQVLNALGTVVFAVGLMNLIPIIPFSGYRILYELVSPNTKMQLINNRHIIQMVVVFLIFFGVFSNVINNTLFLVNTLFRF